MANVRASSFGDDHSRPACWRPNSRRPLCTPAVSSPQAGMTEEGNPCLVAAAPFASVLQCAAASLTATAIAHGAELPKNLSLPMATHGCRQ